MHHGSGENACSTRAQQVSNVLRLCCLLGCGKHQCPLCAQGVNLTLQVFKRARAKHHTRGLAVVDEFLHDLLHRL